MKLVYDDHPAKCGPHRQVVFIYKWSLEQGCLYSGLPLAAETPQIWIANEKHTPLVWTESLEMDILMPNKTLQAGVRTYRVLLYGGMGEGIHAPSQDC